MGADQKLELKMAHEHTAKDSKKDVEIPDIFGIDALDIHGEEPCLVQGAKMAATSFIAGSFFGGVVVSWKDVGVVQKRGRFAALKGIGSYGALFALVGATYGTALCALQHSRTKNDPLNTVLASCAAGGVIGARVNRTVFGSVLGCAVTGGLAAMGEFFDWTLSPNSAKLFALREQKQQRLLRTSTSVGSDAASSDSDAQ